MYYVFIGAAGLLARLPFRMLYGFSNGLAFLLHRVVRYRKSVVYTNLHNAFPEKSAREIRAIARQYYRNLGDIILEVIKLQQMKTAQLMDRFHFENMELLQNILGQNKSVILTIGHCGNWEWMGNTLGPMTTAKGYAVVKPLSDKRFQAYITRLRTRHNPESVIPFKETFRTLVRRKNDLTVNVFAADQTPTRDEINYWTTFLNQDTPFFMGIEKIARTLDMGVVFMEIIRVKRGHYVGRFHPVTESPKETGKYEITEKYVTLLEEAIRRNPDNWLWSHRRWKHKRD